MIGAVETSASDGESGTNRQAEFLGQRQPVG